MEGWGGGYLDPLLDAVVGGGPAILLVVEAGPLWRPVVVVLGGGGDLVRGHLSRLHAQRPHARKVCRGPQGNFKKENL